MRFERFSQWRFEVRPEYVGARSVLAEDFRRRKEELAEYARQPEKKMAVLLPVRDLGARIQWPIRFR
ncbi:hypothetical protein E1B00_06745 [Arenimonas terrae]|uniref:Uncharacterized protein n=1 Tax=Arenimonas terrae TaxID=2546226 RepID=A0A5C4RWN7_9GAMM|nr:hypothetical protein E1B00_06745 [Arenimonas terrae]